MALWSGASRGSLPFGSGSSHREGVSSGKCSDSAASSAVYMNSPPFSFGCSPSQSMLLVSSAAVMRLFRSSTGVCVLRPTSTHTRAYSAVIAAWRSGSASAGTGRPHMALTCLSQSPSSTGGGVISRTRAPPPPHLRAHATISTRLARYSSSGTCWRPASGRPESSVSGVPGMGGGRAASFAPRQTVTSEGASPLVGKILGSRRMIQRVLYPE
mmetsp:Transcript_39/g.106  ORF Transcript_39/g.106 Transcript_39/m.106 type:complete len:213 (-) Transcript_39:138-776(-)